MSLEILRMSLGFLRMSLGFPRISCICLRVIIVRAAPISAEPVYSRKSYGILGQSDAVRFLGNPRRILGHPRASTSNCFNCLID